jgi:hypothetical protein
VGIQPYLIDRLRRTDTVELRRAVRGADDQWDAGKVGLDDAGVKLGRSGPTRRHHQRRHAGFECKTDREKAR